MEIRRKRLNPTPSKKGRIHVPKRVGSKDAVQSKKGARGWRKKAEERIEEERGGKKALNSNSSK